ncbi:response regulator [Pedobacter suwonensis]|uniref:response regulator n=1 Tax=Pedobacter suwonensis TaxID=332999 RepID=UPI0036C1D5F7
MTQIGENKSNGRITIIYAEDERWFRESMVEMLVESGFGIIGAFSDGRELLGFAEGCPIPPDLYLTDLRMPNMNGIELTKEILKKWPNSQVIILTSEIENFYIDQARKAGAVGYLHKIIDYKNIKCALLEVHQTGATTIGKLNL